MMNEKFQEIKSNNNWCWKRITNKTMQSKLEKADVTSMFDDVSFGNGYFTLRNFPFLRQTSLVPFAQSDFPNVEYLMPSSFISKLSLVSQRFSQTWFYVWFPNRHLFLLSMRSGFPEVKDR
jgi:hypothetical protein